MIPMLLKIKIPRSNNRPVNLYIPLLLIWLILLPFAVLLIPFLLLGALLTWGTSLSRLMLFLLPMTIAILASLRGLEIDVQDKHNKIYFSFI